MVGRIIDHEGNMIQFFYFLLYFTLLYLSTFQFLKKVQRQERIVEEIKLVLKPYYNRKKINKDDYKDILRKCVPKVRFIIRNAGEKFTNIKRRVGIFDI